MVVFVVGKVVCGGCVSPQLSAAMAQTKRWAVCKVGWGGRQRVQGRGSQSAPMFMAGNTEEGDATKIRWQ